MDTTMKRIQTATLALGLALLLSAPSFAASPAPVELYQGNRAASVTNPVPTTESNSSAIAGSGASTATNTGNTAASTATIATNTSAIATSTANTAANTSSSATALAAIEAALGNQADGAWAGSGNADEIQLLKAIYNVALGYPAGSTTAGQSGALVMGAVTTVPPSYTTAQTSPLSLDTAGNLRVTCISGCSGTTLGQALMAASLPVAIASNQSPVPTVPSSSTGAAVPNTARAEGLNVDGNLAIPIACTHYQRFNDAAAGLTQIIAASGSTKIYICGFEMFGTGAVTAQLEYGAGSNCGTGTTAITDAFALTAQNGLVSRASYYQGMGGAASNALCLNLGGAVAVQGGIYYAQF